MLLLCTQQCPGLACALGTLAGGNVAYPHGSTTECKQQKCRAFTHPPCAYQWEDLTKYPMSAFTGKIVVIIGFPAEKIAATASIITGGGKKFSKHIAGGSRVVLGAELAPHQLQN